MEINDNSAQIEKSDKMVSTEYFYRTNIKCDFCNRQVHEFEHIEPLSCAHILCSNCYNMIMQQLNRHNLCPICLEPCEELNH